MGLIAQDVLKYLLEGEVNGEPTSQTSKKIARHVLNAYHGRVTWILDKMEENARPINFDGNLVAAQAFKRVIRETRRSVTLWRQKELNDIEEGA